MNELTHIPYFVNQKINVYFFSYQKGIGNPAINGISLVSQFQLVFVKSEKRIPTDRKKREGGMWNRVLAIVIRKGTSGLSNVIQHHYIGR